jgi:3-hydroxybutyryl-CoA dehydrogenase
MNVSVIGAGTMGNGIAHVFAQAGFKVQLIDVSQAALDKAISTITANLDRQVVKGSIDEATKTKTLANLSTYTDIASGVKTADLVVEAATENQELKLENFCSQMDEHAPNQALSLASNTSSISL